MNLFGDSQTLRIVTSSTANLDIAGAKFIADARSSILAAISSATTTPIVDAPGAGAECHIFALVIRNRHASTANTVTVQVFDGTSAFEIFKVTLGAGEQIVYNGIGGWSYLNAQGLPKNAQSQGSSSAAVNEINQVVLASDVVNNNAVANTMQDVTGLSFPVVSGETYFFEFLVDFTAAAATTGSRWSISGPTMARVAYGSTYSLTKTSWTFNAVAGLDLPAASNASSANTTGNMAKITGFCTPSANGNVIARFASEIANSAITAKAGSLLRWSRTR